MPVVKPAQRQGKKERPTGKFANLADGASLKSRTVCSSGDARRRVSKVRVSSQERVKNEKLTEQIRFRETGAHSEALDKAVEALGLDPRDKSAGARIAFRIGVHLLEIVSKGMAKPRRAGK